MSRALRAAALVILMVITFAMGHSIGAAPQPEGLPPPPDYTTYDAAQLSWVAEGIMERISELQDELAEVQAIQAEKLNEEHP